MMKEGLIKLSVKIRICEHLIFFLLKEGNSLALGQILRPHEKKSVKMSVIMADWQLLHSIHVTQTVCKLSENQELWVLLFLQISTN